MENKIKPTLSIIIPAYNEEKRITKTLDDLSMFFNKKKISYEILIVMDGCTDRTEQIVAEKSRKNKNIRYRVYSEKQGKGGAVLKGFSLVRGKYIAYIDADGSTPPRELTKLLRVMGNFDGVIGSRWMEGSAVGKRQPISRRIASRGFNLLTTIILGLPYKDTQCPAKIFKREVINDIKKDFKVTDFAMDACLLYSVRKKGYVVKEVPIAWDDKPLSSLKISKVVLGMLWTTLRTRISG